MANQLDQRAYAAFDGKIERIVPHKAGNNYIEWRDTSGNLHRYFHTCPVNGIVPGTTFKAGDVIGRSDKDVGPHLHWEVRPGTTQFPATGATPPADPEAYLQRFPYSVKTPWSTRK